MIIILFWILFEAIKAEESGDGAFDKYPLAILIVLSSVLSVVFCIVSYLVLRRRGTADNEADLEALRN